MGVKRKRKLREFRSYEDASRWAVTLKLKKYYDWKQYIKHNKIPDDIPKSPEEAYRSRGTWKKLGRILGGD